MPDRPLPTPRRAALLWLLVTSSLVCSAALIAAAVFVPAPAAAIPIVALVSVGCPLVAGVQLPGAIAALRIAAWTARLRRRLDQLPETEHPLGL